MAFVTAAIGLTSAVMSGVQALQNQKKMKQAQAATKSYVNQYKNIKEENAMSALQAPDISSLTADRTAQQTAQSISAVQAMGPEGAAAVAGINKGAADSNLEAMEKQAQLNYKRDVAVASNQQDINQRATEREEGLLQQQIDGSQTAAAEAESARNQAIMSGFEGLTAGLTGMKDTEFTKASKGQGMADPNQLPPAYRNMDWAGVSGAINQ